MAQTIFVIDGREFTADQHTLTSYYITHVSCSNKIHKIHLKLKYQDVIEEKENKVKVKRRKGMITKSCLYYGENDTPEEQEEGVAWIDPGDGSDPFPDMVTYRKGVWMSTGLAGELEPVEDLGEVLCVQKLEFPV